MTERQRIFYGDVPPNIHLAGTIQFNQRLPQNAPPGAVYICAMGNVGGGLNAMFLLVRGRSYMWHEFEPHTSHLFKMWLDRENKQVIRDRAKEVPEFRPWDEYMKDFE